MGLFAHKKGHSDRSSPPKVKVDHLGYPIGPPQYPPHSQQQQWSSRVPVSQAYSKPVQYSNYQSTPVVWNAPPTSTALLPYQDHNATRPVVVNQHYYVNDQPPQPYGYTNGSSSHASHGLDVVSKPKFGSVVDLAQELVPSNFCQSFDDGLPRWHGQATQLLNQGAALYDQIQNKFNDMMTLIDSEKFSGNEKEWSQDQPLSLLPPKATPLVPATERGHPKKTMKNTSAKGQTTAVASSILSAGYASKVDLYANSRLPLDLTPLRLYMPTWPLISLAARYSARVYERPRGAERDAYVDADWKAGTKAMCLKSVPMDHMNTIVFAIRGTATFMDWAVNLNTAPASPKGFLDDTKNCCHAGFLSTARKMVKPVASRLRQLIEENPRRSSYSLLITGHSAGGAVASLLYSHMLATSKSASSELNRLTGQFKRVHCITFGTPPLSVYPLAKPHRHRLKNSLFLSFINEGDPVARADRAYVKSLLELYVTPAPVHVAKGPDDKLSLVTGAAPTKPSRPKEKMSKSTLVSKASKLSLKSAHSSASKSSKSPKPVWHVPRSTLSNAGVIIILRSGNPKSKTRGKKTVEQRLNDGVIAQVANDEQLRGVIWGDPMCHVMKLYAGRVEILAVAAATAQGY
ncbi:hypothetical protein JX265_005792 [Neoarthrinium moseri]|uniref:Fungal lipase-type domain-containing protein n=1 Tax=Neoarthrinium moseri TaxID=1658444 RepID=A0A9P9WN86_9PEZI|nr:hypothetical protein JX265_005792 [Neoarthrinium moseri]